MLLIVFFSPKQDVVRVVLPDAPSCFVCFLFQYATTYKVKNLTDEQRLAWGNITELKVRKEQVRLRRTRTVRVLSLVDFHFSSPQ